MTPARPRPSDWPDLTRTQAAVDAFDHGDATGADVGAAFALDTVDRNDPATARLIRPGPQTPPPGARLSWLRRLLQRWHQTQTHSARG